jgi:hypothetical protein
LSGQPRLLPWLSGLNAKAYLPRDRPCTLELNTDFWATAAMVTDWQAAKKEVRRQQVRVE